MSTSISNTTTPATCSRSVYPPAVIESVTKQMNEYNNNNSNNNNTVKIPESMQMKPCLLSANLLDSVLVELSFDTCDNENNASNGSNSTTCTVGKESLVVKETDILRGREVFQQLNEKDENNNKSKDNNIGSALTLSVLATIYPEVFDGFNIFGIVKESSVDGIIDFYNIYFNKYQLYCDKQYNFYNALGDRKVGFNSIIFNPLNIFGLICDAIQRITDKSIQGNIVGEGIVQGGIIIFDINGKPLAMYQEETGKDIPIIDLVTTLNVIRKQKQQQFTTTSKR